MTALSEIPQEILFSLFMERMATVESTSKTVFTISMKLTISSLLISLDSLMTLTSKRIFLIKSQIMKTNSSLK